MLQILQSGRVDQATSPRLTCVEQEIRVSKRNSILRSYGAVDCSSQVASRRCARPSMTEQPRASQRVCPGRAWNEGTRRQHPGPGHSPPSLATGHTGAEDWTRSFSASSVLESHRSPILRTPGRRGSALFVGEGICFYSLQDLESVHHTTCQTQFLSCRPAPRMPPCSPKPTFPHPAAHRSRLEYISHER